jgi:hypothetical protein
VLNKVHKNRQKTGCKSVNARKKKKNQVYDQVDVKEGWHKIKAL